MMHGVYIALSSMGRDDDIKLLKQADVCNALEVDDAL